MHTHEEFWSSVDRAGGPDACWPWMKGLTSKGYGTLRWRGVPCKANRVALMLHLDRDLQAQALHKCGNRRCCNPRHLYEGTHADNMRDLRRDGTAKGVQAGTKNGRAKLTLRQVRAIRALAARGVPQRALARKYAVSPTAIRKLLIGENWAAFAAA